MQDRANAYIAEDIPPEPERVLFGGLAVILAWIAMS